MTSTIPQPKSEDERILPDAFALPGSPRESVIDRGRRALLAPVLVGTATLFDFTQNKMPGARTPGNQTKGL